MTISAVCKLIPKPPARVDSRKRKTFESGALKASMASCCTQELVHGSKLAPICGLHTKCSFASRNRTAPLSQNCARHMLISKHSHLSVHPVSGPVDSAIAEPIISTNRTIIFEDVEDTRHLGENEHAGTLQHKMKVQCAWQSHCWQLEHALRKIWREQ